MQVSSGYNFYALCWDTNGRNGSLCAYEEIFWEARNSNADTSSCLILVASYRSATFQTAKHAVTLYLYIIELRMVGNCLRQSETLNITSESTVPMKNSPTRVATDEKDSVPRHYNYFTSTRHRIPLNGIHSSLNNDCSLGITPTFGPWRRGGCSRNFYHFR